MIRRVLVRGCTCRGCYYGEARKNFLNDREFIDCKRVTTWMDESCLVIRKGKVDSSSSYIYKAISLNDNTKSI